MDRIIRRALISVSDKTHLELIATRLAERGVEMIASGGTARFLASIGIAVTPIETVTGNPEAFGGRMKTLSFEISSALLFRRGHKEDEDKAFELGIRPIDLVICNLYPFAEYAKRFDAGEAELFELVENIDIGGPTMIRAAAKNYQHVAVLTDPNQYFSLLHYWEENAAEELISPIFLRQKWALEAFKLSAEYETAIATKLMSVWKDDSESVREKRPLRYGENPHQMAWVKANLNQEGIAGANPLQGKELSYNNLLDADAAWRVVSDLALWSPQKNSMAIIKHGNPCGVCVGENGLDVLTRAWECDPVSAFGGILAFSFEVNEKMATWLNDKFVEVIIAPGFTNKALEIFSLKKNLRILRTNLVKKFPIMERSILGGHLIQEEDVDHDRELRSVTNIPFSSEDIELAQFSSLMAKHLKSNAIAFGKKEARGFYLAGAGMGNPNRLVSIDQAYKKALEINETDLSNAVLASDAFFPFADNIELAFKCGIKKIVQPGGSIKDQEVIEACNRLGISMCFTGRRHFRH